MRATRLPSNSRLPAVNITGRQRRSVEQGAYPLISQGFPRISPPPQQPKLSARSHFCFWLLPFLVFCARTDVCSAAAWTQDAGANRTAIVRGRVVDARTGAPLEKAPLVVEDTGQSTQTGADGRFELAGLPPGPHRLSVSVIGYALARREVLVEPGAALDLTIALTEGTTTYTESVTCLLYTSPSPRDRQKSRMPSSA